METSKKLRYQRFTHTLEEHGDTDGFNDLTQGIQQGRSDITKAQRDAISKLEQLDERAKTTFGAILMRSADKKMLKRLDDARAQATDIILSGRNECLRMVTETTVRYTKSLANTLVMTLETSNTVALDGHYMEAKMQLTEKLEDLNNRFLLVMTGKEEQLESSSESVKPMLRDQGLTLMSSWMDDYEKIIHEFSSIRDQRFK